MEIKVEIEAPVGEKELQLAAIWADLLNVKVDRIGRNTSFFELGGDSISAIQLTVLCSEIGIQVTTSSVFRNPTLVQMATLTQSNKLIQVKPLVVP